MSVAIRLRREGNRNNPFYRVVVADKRSPRDGKFLELIGTYDPTQAGRNYEINLERADYWIGCGAQASDTVTSLMKRARKGDEPVTPKKKARPAQAKAPAPAEPEAAAAEVEAPAAEPEAPVAAAETPAAAEAAPASPAPPAE